MEENMDLGKGWKQWRVSLDYITKAMTLLKEYGVTEYFIVPIMEKEEGAYSKWCYCIFYYNEN